MYSSCLPHCVVTCAKFQVSSPYGSPCPNPPNAQEKRSLDRANFHNSDCFK